MSNTVRIAKNTLALYSRQILSMLVGLYTARLVLETLGVEDYGIFNVVGGIVVLFTFLNSAMTSATQRFLNFALGQNDTEQVRNIYSASFIIHALIAVLVVVFAQTIGLWFFHTWLNIPSERQIAALVVYQFSVVTMVIGILQAPYRAIIIAHEKMSFFSILGIIEAVLKLALVLLLLVVLFDKMKAFAFLSCITGIIIFMIHKVYCNRTFTEIRFRYYKDKQLFMQLLGFSGWSVFGGIANISRVQGTNMLVNIFYGVAVNAAMGIATQVNVSVYQLVGNFQTAFSPQIIKSYSAKEYDYFMRLIFRTTKVSFFLLFFFVLPIYINANFVLQIWLNNVPEYAVVFTQLIMISSLLTTIAGPLWMSIQATGDIKKYQLIISWLIFANLPISLLFLWIGFGPVWVLIIRICLDMLALLWRIFFLKGRIMLPIMDFFRNVIVPIVITVGISAFISVFMRNLFINDWNRFIVSCIVSSISICCLVYCVGLNRCEKVLFKDWIKIRIRNSHG